MGLRAQSDPGKAALWAVAPTLTAGSGTVEADLAAPAGKTHVSCTWRRPPSL